jgi:hypothetical protein
MDHPPADLLSNTLAAIRKILDVMQKAGWHISPMRRENVLARTVSFTATSPDAISTFIVCADVDVPFTLLGLLNEE